MTFVLPARSRVILQIRVFFVFVISEAGALYSAILLSPLFYVLTSFLFAIFLFAVFYYIPCFIKTTVICVSKEGVVVKYGVFIKTEKIMPALRLIYVETHQTLLARAMGLCAVSFLGAKVRITTPEMPLSDAEKIINLAKTAKENEKDE